MDKKIAFYLMNEKGFYTLNKFIKKFSSSNIEYIVSSIDKNMKKDYFKEIKQLCKKYKDEYKKKVILKKYSIVGAGSIIMPGVILAKGTSIGAMSLVLKDTKSWSIYVGNPAKELKKRKKNLLKLRKQYLKNGEFDG